MSYPSVPSARWPFTLPGSLSSADIRQIEVETNRLSAASQYGWGHTIDFGPFRKDGLLGESFLRIAGVLDDWGWWPSRLDGLRVADVGCFTGGLSLIMAGRGAATVYAVDEIPAHIDQCAFLAETFAVKSISPVSSSIYKLCQKIEHGSLDIVLLAGVLYHLSDMLTGLYALRELLKPDGLLLVQSNAIDDFQNSYANFGRFYAGMWWQPSGLCVRDMCEYMGYRDCQVRFYMSERCIARAVRAEGEIPFRRGMNWDFADLRDRRVRSLDPNIMAPVPR